MDIEIPSEVEVWGKKKWISPSLLRENYHLML